MQAAFPIGMSQTLSPRIRRVVAANAGAFTGPGTGSYIVGHGIVAVIDPGPDDPAHVAALLDAVAGETVSHLAITHTHRDHSPASRAMQAAIGAPIVGCAPIAPADDGPRVEEGFDLAYAPDRVLADGEAITGPDWRLAAVATPGHTSSHLCYALAQEKALFTGDHVMGWSTTVIAPPDGSMTDYLASLSLLLARDDGTYYPTHGDPIVRPHAHVRGLLLHRRQREAQILGLLADSPYTIAMMVARMYWNIDRRLWPAAGLSVRAHLLDLSARGLASVDGLDVWSGR